MNDEREGHGVPFDWCERVEAVLEEFGGNDMALACEVQRLREQNSRLRADTDDRPEDGERGDWISLDDAVGAVAALLFDTDAEDEDEAWEKAYRDARGVLSEAARLRTGAGEERERDLLWCQALTQTLNPQEMHAVLSYFNEHRPDRPASTEEGEGHPPGHISLRWDDDGPEHDYLYRIEHIDPNTSDEEPDQ